MVRGLVVSIAAMVALPIAAQDGWSRGGSALAGNSARQQQLWMQGALQSAELQAAILDARANKAALDRAELEAKWQDILTSIWKAAGLPDAEATHVASVFRFAPEQDAILDRARRDGVQATIDAAKDAYKGYSYQLANQMMVAAYIVAGEAQRK